MRLLLLDNFDSFTYNLLDYFRQLGCEVEVVRNDVPVALLETLEFDALVLSPGPGTPAAAGNLLAVIAAWHQRVPILGVCLGHQALGEFFGATVTRAARPMHGKVSEMSVTPAEPLFQELPPQLTITRYHSLVVSNLPATLRAIAHTTDDAREIMALRHTTLPLWGVQFHPEALLTTHGLAMLRNWVRHCILVEGGLIKK
ncbi:aminodeoxychorismate/anthranilate synthase component II [Hymenobacter sp. BT186]|uniref:Aminodeoxychorismate/anthranilate synthase component II n=1 Tax=Hymenobacter telluris TaxID=2816474 RepID=A0A939JDZ6_9BACT|nr:aminodeoxychorismate/anthranilate synthase component II [Hymenobacter telluris]MBO0359920.1 aminodeoxychorismate/anthranilate synthase component II [Hymenobacter telluris]MBW3375947.1 aminodeoxychorismate/anthranilate synthase component II [Hymenobacter norwichensis]